MGVWKIGVTIRLRPELRDEMIRFTEHEHRSLGNFGAILLERAFERVKVAGSTVELLGRSSKGLNHTYRDQRLKNG
jgi:hypothetical protein